MGKKKSETKIQRHKKRNKVNEKKRSRENDTEIERRGEKAMERKHEEREKNEKIHGS